MPGDVLAQKEMPVYQCHKRVHALKIATVDVREGSVAGHMLADLTFADPTFAPHTYSLHGKPTPEPGWYLVHYGNGYTSFSPADAFEEGYALARGTTFGDALRWLKQGHKVLRKGWNGKMFLFLVAGSRFKVNRPPLNTMYAEGTEIVYCPHIDMKTADGSIVPWLCSQTDALADDWEILYFDSGQSAR